MEKIKPILIIFFYCIKELKSMKKLLLSSLLLLSYNIPVLSMDPEDQVARQQDTIKDLNFRQLKHRVLNTVPNLISSMQNALDGKKGRAAQMAAQIALQKTQNAIKTTRYGVSPWNIDKVTNDVKEALQVAIEATQDVHVIEQQFDAGHEQDPAIPTRSQARNHRDMVEEVTRDANTIIQEVQEYLAKEKFSEDPATREMEIEAALNAIRTAHEVLEMTHMPITMQNAEEKIMSLWLTIDSAKNFKNMLDPESRQRSECVPLIFEMPKDTVQQ